MSARTDLSPTQDGSNQIERHLDTWVSQRLITRAEADAIVAFEAHPREERARSRMGPLTEALAYLGGALAVAAVGVLLDRCGRTSRRRPGSPFRG